MAKAPFGPSAILLALCLAAGVASGQWVVDSIDIGAWGQDALTYNTSSGVVYGQSWNGRKVFAIACSTDEVVAEIPLTYPIAIAYDSIDNKAWCTFTHGGVDSVLVIDGVTHTRVSAFPLDGAYYPLWDAIGNRLYVSCATGGLGDYVAVIDSPSDSVIATIPIPGEPVWSTVNTRRRKLYCQNDANMTVSVIDLNTNQVIRNVYTGSWFFAAAYSAAADKYYCDGAQGVAVIDGAGDSLVEQIRLPPGYGLTAMVAVDPESLVMVTTSSGGSDSVYAIDAVRNTIRSALRVSRSPRAITYSAATGLVYSASASTSDRLDVIADDGSRVRSQVAVSDGPHSLLVCPPYEKLYVGHGGMTNMVYVIRDELGIAEYEPAPTEGANAGTAIARAKLSYNGLVPATLVDAGGRKVQNLHVGSNDLSRLSPGVYFIRSEPASIRRVVVAR